MRPDGTSRVAIGPGGSEERMPAVSPDGEYIAFIQFEGERRRLAVRSFDGKRERVLLRSGWVEFPVW
jgi:Tol biopolymer transport system component